MNKKFSRSTIILSIVVYVLLIYLTFIFTFYVHINELFRIDINPLYLWIPIFLVSVTIIPCFIILNNNFKLLGEELYQEKLPFLYSLIAMLSVVPATFALLNAIFTGVFQISAILLIYGGIFGIITYLSLGNSSNNNQDVNNNADLK